MSGLRFRENRVSFFLRFHFYFRNYFIRRKEKKRKVISTHIEGSVNES